MGSIRALRVAEEDAGKRLDQFLAAAIDSLTRSRIQELIHEGRARVDGRVCSRSGLKLRGGEAIEFEVVERPPLLAEPEDIPLDILYEDDAVVAVHKPAGMVVHLAAGARQGTLVNALLHRYQSLPQPGGPIRSGLVHRLDKETSGVLLVAKTEQAHGLLTAQFAARTVQKEYLALVHGRMKEEQGRIRLPVARDRVRRTRMTTRRKGRAADTEYRVIEVAERYSLLHVILHTGRTHQIRVHFSALGRPVVGDKTYGAPGTIRVGNRNRPTLNRNFLHAWKIQCTHPVTDRPLAVTAPLPPELTAVLEEFGFAWRPED